MLLGLCKLLGQAARDCQLQVACHLPASGDLHAVDRADHHDILDAEATRLGDPIGRQEVFWFEPITPQKKHRPGCEGVACADDSNNASKDASTLDIEASF